MKCPFFTVKGKKCKNSECVFSSRVNKSRCFYGEEVSVSNVALHKDISTRRLKAGVAEIQSKVTYSIKLLKYAEYCKDIKASAGDRNLHRQLQLVKPYKTKLFSFVTPERIARMRQQDALDAFVATGVSIDEPALQFITKPLEQGWDHEQD